MTERHAARHAETTARGPIRDEAAGTGLLDEIRGEIEAAGPVTFARFMELALYHPRHGYYRTIDPRTTRSGDFLTAPEMDPIFGRTLGRWAGAAWESLGKPHPFTVVEYGAGSGALAAGLVEGLAAFAPGALAALRYAPVEVNEHRRRELTSRLARAGLADRLLDPCGLDAEPAVGLALANEFVDALPVHRLEVRHGELRERYVGWASGDPEGGGLVELLGPLSDPALADRPAAEGVVLAEGQQVEVCLELDPWLAEVRRRLSLGLVLILDYGAEATELYDDRHRAGTMLSYAHHRATDSLLEAVGRRDLTAHVDLTALREAAARQGLGWLGRTSQQRLLVAAGLEAELRDRQATLVSDASRAVELLQAYAGTRSAVARLLDPRGLGGFAAVLLGIGGRPETPLPGFPTLPAAQP